MKPGVSSILYLEKNAGNKVFPLEKHAQILFSTSEQNALIDRWEPISMSGNEYHFLEEGGDG